MSNSTRELLGFEISKMLITVLRNTFNCVICYDFRHTFVPCRYSKRDGQIPSRCHISVMTAGEERRRNNRKRRVVVCCSQPTTIQWKTTASRLRLLSHYPPSCPAGLYDICPLDIYPLPLKIAFMDIRRSYIEVICPNCNPNPVALRMARRVGSSLILVHSLLFRSLSLLLPPLRSRPRK